MRVSLCVRGSVGVRAVYLYEYDELLLLLDVDGRADCGLREGEGSAFARGLRSGLGLRFNVSAEG